MKHVGGSRSEPAMAPLPWLYLVIPFVVAAIAAVVVIAFYDLLPDPLPTHWNAQGVADGFADKTIATALGANVGLPIFLGLVSLGCIGLMRVQAGDKPVSPSKEDIENRNGMIATLSKTQYTLAKFMALLATLITADLMLSMFGILRSKLAVVSIIAGFVLAMVWLAVELKRNNDEVSRSYPNEISNHMKWGMFYFNPEDDRTMIHHMGGSTVNFARPGGWAVIGGLTLPIVMIAILAAVAG